MVEISYSKCATPLHADFLLFNYSALSGAIRNILMLSLVPLAINALILVIYYGFGYTNYRAYP